MQKLLATRGLGPSASTKAEASPAIDISGMDEMSLSMRKLLPVHLRAAYDQNWARSTLARDASPPAVEPISARAAPLVASQPSAPSESAAASILRTDTAPARLSAAAPANIQPAPTAATSKSRPSVPTHDDVLLIRKFSADIKTLSEQEALNRRDDMLRKIEGLYPELATNITDHPVSEWASHFVLWQAVHEQRVPPSMV
jgi:hypothetical protein